MKQCANQNGKQVCRPCRAWSTALAGPLHRKIPSINSSNVTCDKAAAIDNDIMTCVTCDKGGVAHAIHKMSSISGNREHVHVHLLSSWKSSECFIRALKGTSQEYYTATLISPLCACLCHCLRDLAQWRNCIHPGGNISHKLCNLCAVLCLKGRSIS